ncbi:MAG: heavy metal transporter [Dyadobacter sp. 50-39]|uniref:mercuric transport protein MerTP n=1 Tax=Dyadobacter sp. 50-39 TaxID=1895756 RepID=UPI00095DBDB6|nr:mercuric transport protein MerTP [Dyadobacter sp. 50-39]OJV19162.1 MAG: heavy metal transporter [Dyadobacter sp. 50-39]
MKTTGLIGLLTAFASSLCCTVPLLAVIFGISGSASGLVWLESFRPYSIALTIGALGWAWYNQLKSNKMKDCMCDTNKTSFWQTKAFLGIITGLALLLLTFPSYSNLLYQEKAQEVLQPAQDGPQKVAYVTIKGMSCESCEHHIKKEVAKLKGVSQVDVSYQKGAATVKFDSKKTSIADIKKAVDATGYKVTSTKTL